MLWVITAFEDDFNKQVFEILLLHCNGWLYNRVTAIAITGRDTYTGLGKYSLQVFLSFLFLTHVIKIHTKHSVRMETWALPFALQQGQRSSQPRSDITQQSGSKVMDLH